MYYTYLYCILYNTVFCIVEPWSVLRAAWASSLVLGPVLGPTLRAQESVCIRVNRSVAVRREVTGLRRVDAGSGTLRAGAIGRRRRGARLYYVSAPGAALGAACVWVTPQVRVTWGFIWKNVS